MKSLRNRGLGCIYVGMLFCIFQCSCVGARAADGAVIRRYGVLLRAPEAPHVTLMKGRHGPMYTSPYAISYSYDRPGALGTSFDVRFFTAPPVWDNDGVKALLSNFPLYFNHKIESTELKKINFKSADAYRFVLAIKPLSVGSEGVILKISGYILMHPYDKNYVVCVSFSDKYDESSGGKADAALEETAERWMQAVRFEQPTSTEDQFMRKAKWVEP